MKVRKSLAAALLASSAVLLAAGCSSDNNTVTSATNKASEIAGSVTSAAKDAASNAKQAIVGLDNAEAQNIFRKAVDPATSDADLEKVVDLSNPVTKAAIQGYAKGASAAGYGPEIYTVRSVQSDGDDKATVTVAVASPHAPQPIDMQFTYVKVNGDWKLSGDAITQLTSMMTQHGG